MLFEQEDPGSACKHQLHKTPSTDSPTALNKGSFEALLGDASDTEASVGVQDFAPGSGRGGPVDFL